MPTRSRFASAFGYCSAFRYCCAPLLAAALVLALGACGSGDNQPKATTTTGASSATTGGAPGTSGPSTSAAAGEQAIAIQSFKFNPATLSTKPGKVTVVILDDGVPHSLTADDKSFDTGVFKKEDGPATITLSKAGTFTYHCEVHQFMKGVFQVS